jgi:hypothetical protein
MCHSEKQPLRGVFIESWTGNPNGRKVCDLDTKEDVFHVILVENHRGDVIHVDKFIGHTNLKGLKLQFLENNNPQPEWKRYSACADANYRFWKDWVKIVVKQKGFTEQVYCRLVWHKNNDPQKSAEHLTLNVNL